MTDCDLPPARLEILLRASRTFGDSLDLSVTLASLAEVFIPFLADGYAVDLVDERGAIRRIAAVHADADMAPLCERLLALGALNPNAPEGIQRILEAGVPRLTEQVTDEGLRAGARDEEHLAILRALEPRSMLIVPLMARSRAIGLLWLYYSTRSNRVYRHADLALVEEIAARAALAINNSQLWREAQEAIRARDEFLAIASHELRTPLTSMLLRVQGELRKLDKNPSHAPARPEVEAWLGAFNQQTARLAQLVAEMLDISRMATDGVKLAPEPVDLGEVVGEAAVALAEDARKKGSALELQAPSGIRGTWDGVRIAQIVRALVSNAIKYGAGKPITVRVGTAGDSAEIAVSDRGIGIERAHLGRIFERFERPASFRNYGGLGLGLWRARQLVEASGGTIAVTSAPGDGATFRVTLPRTPAPGGLERSGRPASVANVEGATEVGASGDSPR
jgi:signal transduction histidine kinase